MNGALQQYPLNCAMQPIFDFHFNTALAASYKSPSQRIRVMSEHWVGEHLFCPCCGNPQIAPMQTNSPVGDFVCEACGEEFELKSAERHVGRKIADGAYSTMIRRISSRNNPHLFVLTYSESLAVSDFMFIPKFFFVPGIIEKRNPLAPTARRAGWVGCNILIGDVPRQGRISVIENSIVRSPDDVVDSYRLATTLRKDRLEARGWLYDVLNLVNGMNGDEFDLAEVYRHVPILRQKYPENANVEAKIRQQLQFLRDKGFIAFLGRGRYRRLL